MNVRYLRKETNKPCIYDTIMYDRIIYGNYLTNPIYGTLKIVQPVIYYPSNWRFFSTVSEEPHDHDALGPLGATGHLLGEAWRQRAR